MDTEEFINKINKKFTDNTFDFSNTTYTGYKNPITIICKHHGPFVTTPDRMFLKNVVYGCPECGKKNRKKKVNTENFVEKARAVHGERYDYSKSIYKSTHSKICIICSEHGEFWQTPANHLRGSGCPKCKAKKSKESQIKDTSWFIDKAKIVHGDKYDYSKVNYIGAVNKVSIVCPKHGEFKQQAESHLQGSGCPLCNSKKEQNKIYNLIVNSFPKLQVIQEYSPSWLGRQRIDIAIPTINIGIEYDGRQHFVPVERFGGEIEFQKTTKRDELKNQLCDTNNFKLFRLRYDYTEEDLNDIINYIKMNQYET